MPRYSDALHPEIAADAYDGLPGNYVLVDRQGRAYAGRQSLGGKRIARHVRDNPDEFVAAHFMINHTDDECVRADREAARGAAGWRALAGRRRLRGDCARRRCRS